VLRIKIRCCHACVHLRVFRREEFQHVFKFLYLFNLAEELVRSCGRYLSTHVHSPPCCSSASKFGFAAGCEARLCLAGSSVNATGLGPSYRLWPIFRAKPEPGAKPTWFINDRRRGIASPHIRRRSRNDMTHGTIRHAKRYATRNDFSGKLEEPNFTRHFPKLPRQFLRLRAILFSALPIQTIG
jgi:hypothetical protein